MKREFYVEYGERMASEPFIVNARSKEEITDRYPLFKVFELGEAVWLKPETLEHMRMFPGKGRPADRAVQHWNDRDRARFLEARKRHLEAILSTARKAGHLEKMPQAFNFEDHQRWVDIDDDMDFRMTMHDAWKNDPRYQALPPEKRLF